jgi:hypothetical protein
MTDSDENLETAINTTPRFMGRFSDPREAVAP